MRDARGCCCRPCWPCWNVGSAVAQQHFRHLPRGREPERGGRAYQPVHAALTGCRDSSGESPGDSVLTDLGTAKSKIKASGWVRPRLPACGPAFLSCSSLPPKTTNRTRDEDPACSLSVSCKLQVQPACGPEVSILTAGAKFSTQPWGHDPAAKTLPAPHSTPGPDRLTPPTLGGRCFWHTQSEAQPEKLARPRSHSP